MRFHNLFLALLLLISSPSMVFGFQSMEGKLWPDLVGMSGEEAKAKLEEEHPGLTVQVIPEGSMMTMDYRTDRVRIMVDGENKVNAAPRVG
mmetsp:Transcript_14620/g.21560  ORF Transcript_14620/g.21560 Transcript_14620/m.21560 type:complete len:91 (-) Transcript_14620:327-599(-)|eukprot:CAMPEP_0194200012 /NCGR_PEP_ID=MMETSP0156-20130528/811_1 /TAXON_ID=33649 /ORGANISM="Thalassionema nitzschioides, Strain L26-B" /LENGTH=90 /DNA_ID=CAMNT_0038924977 /DNA_START=28 /DNA_END=300 /DNA_ORIENTATION=-